MESTASASRENRSTSGSVFSFSASGSASSKRPCAMSDSIRLCWSCVLAGSNSSARA